VTQPRVVPAGRWERHRAATWSAICVALLVSIAVPVVVSLRSSHPPGSSRPIHYLGLYTRGVPFSYNGLAAFTTATGVRPDMLMYYSAWQQPFESNFATAAAKHGAVPLVQINPFGVSLAAIVSGQYDSYLRTYAKAVRTYRNPVILSFGHEMNGHWESWGYTHTSPAVFVAAWRHIVTLFRNQETRNVTWLWTVNIIDTRGSIPSPSPWWPGRSYVNWVGIDGYYYSPSLTFTSLFGPTIVAVRELTDDPILIAETGVVPTAGQPAKIADLFAGIHVYGLLGFVWFQVPGWDISSPSAIAAYRQGAETYRRPVS
jgi:mannan endo-1,4-beta-mannosidase